MTSCWPPAAVVAPVRYCVDSDEWLDATVIEIGRLSLVIRTPHSPPPLYAPLEMRITLAGGDWLPRSEVVCSGRVVNIAPPMSTGERLMAVTVDR